MNYVSGAKFIKYVINIKNEDFVHYLSQEFRDSCNTVY